TAARHTPTQLTATVPLHRSSSPLSFFFFFYCSRDHRHLHSFPTRRSSDLSVPLLVRIIFPCSAFRWPRVARFCRTKKHRDAGRRWRSSVTLTGRNTINPRLGRRC